MVTAIPHTEKSSHTRQRILEAAREVVALNGWGDARIAHIAARAGVATGTVYRYFVSKAELYAEVLALVSRQEIEVVAAIVHGDGTAARRLVDAIHAFARRAMKNRRLAYALLAEPCEPEIDSARLKYRAALAGQIAQLIEQGTASGEFIEVDSELAASCVTGAFMEALVGPLAPDSEPDSQAGRAAARTISELVARMLFKQTSPGLTTELSGEQQ